MEIIPTAQYNISGQHIIDMTDALAKRMIETVRNEVKGDEWYTQEEAMKYLKVLSAKKMKAIRETGKVKYKKLGHDFRYSLKSLEKFMNG